jgi:hypothetical protein
LLGVVLLAPVWAAVSRFVILNDRSRGYYPFDVRVRRVLRVTFMLSLLAMLGSLPFAFSLDFGSRAGARRSLILAVMGAAALCKLAALWLSCRLAIAPPLAAAGARQQALDTSFAYTPGAAWPILMLKLLIYLPIFALVGGLMLIGQRTETDLVNQLWAVAIVTLLTAASDLTDAIAMAIVAVKLIRLRTSPQA